MRTILLLTLVLWLAIGLGFSALFSQVPYAALATRMQQPNYAAEFTPPPIFLTPARYEALRRNCLLLAGGAAAGVLGLLAARRRSPPAARHPGLRRIWAALLRPWWRLSRGQRQVVLVLAVAAGLLRAWLLLAQPITTDELTSYDYYVWPGPALTASSYSLPNNHILYNLLVGALAGTGLPPDYQQRAPAVLVGLGLLPLSYLLLLRHLRFGVATLALALFTFSTTPAFYAVAGRGYGVQLAAAVAGFFAVLELLRPGGLRQLPWLVFGGSGVVGLYAVPTHAYVLAALGLGLLVGFGQQTGRLRWPNLARLALATACIGATAALLYGPVGVASGWGPLLHNPYVRSLSGPEFWRGLGPYLQEAATRLWGQGRVALLALVVLAGLIPWLLRRAEPKLRAIGWLSYAGLFLPLPLLLVQHVYVPGRALLPGMFFSFVLLALVAEAAARWLLARLPAGGVQAARRLYPVALAGLVLAYGAYRFGREARGMRVLAARYAALYRQQQWLRAQQPSRVWLDSLSRPYQGIYWYHIGLLHHAPLPLVVVPALPTNAASREYAVLDRQHGAKPPPALATRPPAYRDAYVCIWQLPRLATRPAVSKPGILAPPTAPLFRP